MKERNWRTSYRLLWSSGTPHHVVRTNTPRILRYTDLSWNVEKSERIRLAPESHIRRTEGNLSHPILHPFQQNNLTSILSHLFPTMKFFAFVSIAVLFFSGSLTVTHAAPVVTAVNVRHKSPASYRFTLS